jgi:hypothetical protein
VFNAKINIYRAASRPILLGIECCPVKGKAVDTRPSNSYSPTPVIDGAGAQSDNQG